MREYIVTKELLNIRSKPSDESDETYLGHLLKGERVWLDDEDIVGVVPKGGESNVWKKKTGSTNVVARDGVRSINYEDKKDEFLNDSSMSYLHNNSKNESDWKISWAHVDLDIWKIWRELGIHGENIDVVVLDTGITSNLEDFSLVNSGSTIKGIDFIKGVAGLDNSIDINDHGTNSAAILAATGKQKIYGIAPKANLFIVKIASNLSVPLENLKKGIELIKLNNWQPDIISISFCLPSDDNDFKNLINSMPDCLIVSSLMHPDGRADLGIENNQFPVSYENVIPIAAFDKAKKIVAPCNFLENKICWAFPGENILTLDCDGDRTSASHTSIATPLAAGFFALLFSYLKKKNIEINRQNILKLQKKLVEGNMVTQPILRDNSQINLNVCMITSIQIIQEIKNIFQT